MWEFQIRDQIVSIILEIIKTHENKQIFILDLGEKYCKILKLTPL
jgi:hypothetical protein